MKRLRAVLCAGLSLLLLPALARAEVSVQLDHEGHLKRVVYLTRGRGRAALVWKQVRGRLPLEVMLNPLGDTLGDLPPSIAIHPTTGFPWVVWPRNIGNQKRLAFSTWNGTAWTAPVLIARPDPMGWDQVEPRLIFDAQGIPYLVYTEQASPARVMFMTMARGSWTPSLLLSRQTVDSRSPNPAIDGPDLKVAWSTPDGTVVRSLSTTLLLDAASNLMDSPIPPGLTPAPKDTGGGSDETPQDQFIIHR